MRFKTTLTFWIISFVAWGFAALGQQEPPVAKEEVYVPYDVEDACIALKKLLPKDYKASSDPFTPPMAMQLRNMWIHGPGENGRLKRYFQRKGIFNADLMSNIILEAFLAREGGKKFSLRESIAKVLREYSLMTNMVWSGQTSPPKDASKLWTLYFIQKDDLNVIHVCCDDTGTPKWCFDPDGGWFKATESISAAIQEGRAIRLLQSYEDDGGPFADYAKRFPR